MDKIFHQPSSRLALSAGEHRAAMPDHGGGDPPEGRGGGGRTRAEGGGAESARSKDGISNRNVYSNVPSTPSSLIAEGAGGREERSRKENLMG